MNSSGNIKHILQFTSVETWRHKIFRPIGKKNSQKSCQNPYLRTATLVNPTEDEIIQEAAEEAISAEYDMEVKIYYDEARKRAEGLQQRLALPLFWENQKINFVLAFFGYACSH